MDKNTTAFGRYSQPDSEKLFGYDWPMPNNPLNTKKILWKNVQALMDLKYGKENLWQFCKFVDIGPGTGTRIKQMETSVGIEVLEKIAAKFDLHPWHLLVPNLDPKNPPVVLISDTEQKFYANLKEASKAFAQTVEE